MGLSNGAFTTMKMILFVVCAAVFALIVLLLILYPVLAARGFTILRRRA